jgi:uncharacterized protein YvpB
VHVLPNRTVHLVVALIVNIYLIAIISYAEPEVIKNSASHATPIEERFIDWVAPSIKVKTAADESIPDMGYTNRNVHVDIYDQNLMESVIKLDDIEIGLPRDGMLTAPGTYSIYARDIVNNTTTFQFTIDKKSPVIKGLGKMEKSTSHILNNAKIKIDEDNISDIIIHLDGQEVNVKDKYRLSAGGKYAYAATDKAGNGSIAEFEIFKNLDVPVLLQYPTLPTGCEITALTCVMNYYGFNVSKETMSDKYLEKTEFYYWDGVKYGPDPEYSFAGDPRWEAGTSSWYCFDKVIVDAANKYFKSNKVDKAAVSITGASLSRLKCELDKGNPVIFWATLNMDAPRFKTAWVIPGYGSYTAFTNLHCLVLKGYDDKSVYIMDPINGEVKCDTDRFLSSYNSLGKRAVVIDESRNNLIRRLLYWYIDKFKHGGYNR